MSHKTLKIKKLRMIKKSRHQSPKKIHNAQINRLSGSSGTDVGRLQFSTRSSDIEPLFDITWTNDEMVLHVRSRDRETVVSK